MTTLLAGRSSLRDWRAIALIPRLSAFLVIAIAARSTGRVTLGLAVALVVFGSDRIARNGWFWIGVGVIVGGWNFIDWATIDNHIVLSGYWFLALGGALLSDDPEHRMASAARLLVGVVFTAAVIRKVVSPDFVSGDFFVFTLLVDPRFEQAAIVVGGVSETFSNRAALGGLPDAVVLTSAAGIRPLAMALTWGALVIESAVAVFSLLPAAISRRAGQASLVAFIMVTYLIVPVVAFGAGLIVMGAASASTDRGRMRWALGFLALAVWGYAWQGYTL